MPFIIPSVLFGGIFMSLISLEFDQVFFLSVPGRIHIEESMHGLGFRYFIRNKDILCFVQSFCFLKLAIDDRTLEWSFVVSNYVVVSSLIGVPI